MNRGRNWVALLALLLFVASTSINTRYVSAQGPLQSDAWPTSDPEQQNMNSTLIEEAAEYVIANAQADVNSLIVIRNKHIVFERYFRPYLFDADDPNVSNSPFSLESFTNHYGFVSN